MTSKTKQEWFNAAWEQAKGKKRAMVADPVKDGGVTPLSHCVYRTPDGNRCFIGAGIEDVDYTPDMEKTRASSLLERNRIKVSDVDDEFIARDFLDHLQCTHDGYRTQDWEKKLRDFADRHGLEIPVG